MITLRIPESLEQVVPENPGVGHPLSAPQEAARTAEYAAFARMLNLARENDRAHEDAPGPSGAEGKAQGLLQSGHGRPSPPASVMTGASVGTAIGWRERRFASNATSVPAALHRAAGQAPGQLPGQAPGQLPGQPDPPTEAVPPSTLSGMVAKTLTETLPKTLTDPRTGVVLSKQTEQSQAAGLLADRRAGRHMPMGASASAFPPAFPPSIPSLFPMDSAHTNAPVSASGSRSTAASTAATTGMREAPSAERNSETKVRRSPLQGLPPGSGLLPGQGLPAGHSAASPGLDASLVAAVPLPVVASRVLPGALPGALPGQLPGQPSRQTETSIHRSTIQRSTAALLDERQVVHPGSSLAENMRDASTHSAGRLAAAGLDAANPLRSPDTEAASLPESNGNPGTGAAYGLSTLSRLRATPAEGPASTIQPRAETGSAHAAADRWSTQDATVQDATVQDAITQDAMATTGRVLTRAGKAGAAASGLGKPDPQGSGKYPTPHPGASLDRFGDQSGDPFGRASRMQFAVDGPSGSNPFADADPASPLASPTTSLISPLAMTEGAMTQAALTQAAATGDAASSANPFLHMDTAAASGRIHLHPTANSLQATFIDGDQGVASVRAEMIEGRVRASIDTVAPAAHADFAAQLPSIHQFLAEARAPVEHLSIDLQSRSGEGEGQNSRPQPEERQAQDPPGAVPQPSTMIGLDAGGNDDAAGGRVNLRA